MQALILAAGMGKRLGELTKKNTKCMISVNGNTLIERMLCQLEQHNLSRIVIVVGYQGTYLKEYIATLNVKTPICYVENNVYDKTNNIYSLFLAKDYLCEEDTLLLESDLIFEDSVLDVLLNDARDTLALVDKYESWMDGTCIKVGENDTIDAFIPGKKFVFEDIPDYFKTVNIYKFGRDFSTKYYVPFLEAYSGALGNNEYYEQVLRVITMLDEPHIWAKKLNGQKWYEIDDIQDLDIASSIFAESSNEKLHLMQKRYGGYWRYPKMLDFCYLVNPYYPPQKLLNEIKANMDKLIMQYPSGIEVNNLLVSKMFHVKKDYILVGNGAAELIQCLMRYDLGKLGVIVPTFEEYVNRYQEEKIVRYDVAGQGFQYTVKDIMNFLQESIVQTFLLINPDNPSGNYICKKDILVLLDFCREKEIRIILDESFIDFAEDDDSSAFCNEILEQYNNLIIVKSISKSYGVPGLRLGVLATSDCEIMQKIKKDVSIWNINSLGEFFLQIEEKYIQDYLNSLKMLKEARREFVENLNNISNIKVIKSQANYVMIKLPEDISATEVCQRLLVENNIFAKDLSAKIDATYGQYIRVAVRSKSENRFFIEAIKGIIVA